MPRPRLLVCTHEPLGDALNGTAIRATELARAARAVADVTLAAPSGGDVEFHPHDPRPLRSALRGADVVLSTPLWPRHVAAITGAGVPWICDLYIPEPLETLEHFRERPPLRRLMGAFAVDRLDDALAHAALLLCATGRQRDLWTGALLADRGVPPAAYDADPTLGARIAVVPFGLPAEPPPDVARPGPLRRRFGLDAEVPVVVWNGGTWPWFDPAAAVEAVLAHEAAHLVFLGGADARVTPGPRVHVNDGWVPYAERGAWLRDADAAISTHHEHLETRFSFRTRILDALWAGLPVVCTGGDELGDLVARRDLGAVAAPGDAAALAAGVADALARDRSAALRAVAAELAWPVVTRPLLDALAAGPGRLPRPAPGRSPHPARLARTLAYRAAPVRLLPRL